MTKLTPETKCDCGRKAYRIKYNNPICLRCDEIEQEALLKHSLRGKRGTKVTEDALQFKYLYRYRVSSLIFKECVIV